MNQYVVDSAEQTSGFGAYSLTYLGLDLDGITAPDGVTPGRFFTHYFNSSPVMREYAAERGVPASPGTTTVEVHGHDLVATTSVDGLPIIRTRARIGKKIGAVARGHLAYLTQLDGKILAGNYAYIGELVDAFSSSSRSVEFLAKDHPVRRSGRGGPSSPSPPPPGSRRATPFVYPGGERESDRSGDRFRKNPGRSEVPRSPAKPRPETRAAAASGRASAFPEPPPRRFSVASSGGLPTSRPRNARKWGRPAGRSLRLPAAAGRAASRRPW